MVQGIWTFYKGRLEADGRMNMNRYTNEVLEPLFYPFYLELKLKRKREIWSMEDNAK